MIHRFIASLFEKEPASFPAAGSPREAADRLRAGVKRSWLPWLFQACVFGSVEPEAVTLRVHRPLRRNGFVLVFRGRFEVVDGGTLLRGDFSLNRLGQVYMTLWLGCLGLIAIAAPIIAIGQTLQGSAQVWTSLAAGLFISAAAVGIAALGWAFVRQAIRSGRKDVDEISRTIRSALG